jgi:hypothetical protein
VFNPTLSALSKTLRLKHQQKKPAEWDDRHNQGSTRSDLGKWVCDSTYVELFSPLQSLHLEGTRTDKWACHFPRIHKACMQVKWKILNSP